MRTVEEYFFCSSIEPIEKYVFSLFSSDEAKALDGVIASDYANMSLIHILLLLSCESACAG